MRLRLGSGLVLGSLPLPPATHPWQWEPRLLLRASNVAPCRRALAVSDDEDSRVSVLLQACVVERRQAGTKTSVYQSIHPQPCLHPLTPQFPPRSSTIETTYLRQMLSDERPLPRAALLRRAGQWWHTRRSCTGNCWLVMVGWQWVGGVNTGPLAAPRCWGIYE